MNLEKMNLVEMDSQEVIDVDGGLWGEIVTVGIAVGGACSWLFEKGESFGRHLAQCGY